MFENLNLRGWFAGMFARALGVTKRNWYRNTILDSRQPIVVDFENLFDVYQSCPHLQTVINKKAEMLSNGRLVLKKKDTHEEVENHWSLDLLRRPNPLQNFREFTYEYSLYADIYANNFVYKNAPFITSKPKTITNLPSGQIQIIPTGKWLDQTELSGIVKAYRMLNVDKVFIKDYTTDEVAYVNSGISKSPLVADSKIISLQFPVSNIIGALKTRNMFIYYGPKMLISAKQSDSDSALPMGKTEKERIEKDFNQVDYGINDVQSHTVVSSASLTASKMSYPTKDLMLFEEIEDDFNAICGAYGMDRDIFPSIKGATFENKEKGERATYQNTITTCAKTYADFLSQITGVESEGLYYCLEYDHLAIMKENELDEANENKVKVDTLAVLFDKGIISPQAFADMMDVEYTGTPTNVGGGAIVSVGKIPLALQQLALARERANTANDTELSDLLAQAMEQLTRQMAMSIIQANTTN